MQLKYFVTIHTSTKTTFPIVHSTFCFTILRFPISRAKRAYTLFLSYCQVILIELVNSKSVDLCIVNCHINPRLKLCFRLYRFLYLRNLLPLKRKIRISCNILQRLNVRLLLRLSFLWRYINILTISPYNFTIT